MAPDVDNLQGRENLGQRSGPPPGPTDPQPAMIETAETLPAPRLKAGLDRLKNSITRIIRGKDDVVEQVITAFVAGGHVLIEDLPGLGKTTLAYCLARSLAGTFSRIQFTSDLLPTDVIGVSIYDESERAFIFRPGPIFASIVLADEINRTTPKTQSALLEAMDRGKVTVDGKTYPLPTPFSVIATQNPVDYEGTFPLPESQMDRFLLRIQMGYPPPDKELEILAAGMMKYDLIEPEAVLRPEEVREMQHWVPRVHVEPAILRYILQIVSATRTESEFRAGVSTRGSLSLKLASQAAALIRGRAFVIPEDVSRMALPVLVHRIGLRRQTSDPLEERRLVEGILRRTLESIPPPV